MTNTILSKSTALETKSFPLWFRIFLMFQIFIFLVFVCAFISKNISPDIQITAFGFKGEGMVSSISISLITLLTVNFFVALSLLSANNNIIKFAKYYYQFCLVLCSIAIVIFAVFPESRLVYFPLEMFFLGLSYLTLKTYKL